MGYKEALAEIEKTLPELAEVIKTHVGTLNAESADRRVKLTDAIKVIDAIKAIAGPDVEDLVKFVAEAKKTADTSGKSTSDLQTQLDAALALSVTKERQYLLLKASQISNADEKALNELLKDVSNDKIVVADDVKIDGKPLIDFAKEKGTFWERALFVAAGEPNSAGKGEPMPTGGGKPEAINPANDYIANQAAAMIPVLNKAK